MKELLTFTEKDFERPLTRYEELALTVEVMFDGENPVRTLDVDSLDNVTTIHRQGNALVTGVTQSVKVGGTLPLQDATTTYGLSTSNPFITESILHPDGESQNFGVALTKCLLVVIHSYRLSSRHNATTRSVT